MSKNAFLSKDVFGLFPPPLHQLIWKSFLDVRNSPYNKILPVGSMYLSSIGTCILQSDTGGGKKVERKEEVS